MKSKITENRRPLLSIGLIVKNEEKNIEKCLSSIARLKNYFSCEIIVTDTGSQDKTVEIAKKYADKMLYFNWINDFSAARNFGLKQCSGEWFMYIDADETADEDLRPLISFFTDKNMLAKYNSALVTIRNYSGKNNYNDSYPSRIIRNSGNIFFSGKIHETLPAFSPQFETGQLFHHTGYEFSDETESHKKTMRNMSILSDELANDPENIRTMLHMFFISDDADEREKLSEKMIGLLGKGKYSFLENSVLSSSAFFYLCTAKFEKALALAEKFFSSSSAEKSVTKVHMQLIRADVFYSLKNYSNAEKEFELYFKYFNEYTCGKLDRSDLKYGPLMGLTDADHSTMLYAAAETEISLGKYGNADGYIREFADKKDFTTFDFYPDMTISAMKLCGKYSGSADIFEKLADHADISDGKLRSAVLSETLKNPAALYTAVRYDLLFPAEYCGQLSADSACEMFGRFPEYAAKNISAEKFCANEASCRAAAEMLHAASMHMDNLTSDEKSRLADEYAACLAARTASYDKLTFADETSLMKLHEEQCFGCILLEIYAAVSDGNERKFGAAVRLCERICPNYYKLLEIIFSD